MRQQLELGLRKFVTPEIIFGSGARLLAGRYARNLGARKVLVVTDPGVVDAGWTVDVTTSLNKAQISYTVYDKLSTNPEIEDVLNGAELYHSEHCDIIVAVGGGSTIDCAKGIGIVSSNKGNILDFEGIDNVSIPIPPLICVPTTSGSSADVSQFSVIRNPSEKTTIVIGSKAIVPDVSLVDPDTLMTMSQYLTACSAFDALTHAIEAYVSNAHSPLTDLHALEAIRLIAANLIPALKEPTNYGFRTQLMNGSLGAGIAFSNAVLGAVHSLSHSLAGLFSLAHGEYNSVLLSHVIAFNYYETEERYKRIGEAFGLDFRGMKSSQVLNSIISFISDLKKAAGLERTLKEMGVKYSDIPFLANNAFNDPFLVTNPRRVNKRDIEVLYEEAF
jgi:alcohol dehydrogenase